MIEATAIYATLDYLNDSLGALNVKLANIKGNLNRQAYNGKDSNLDLRLSADLIAYLADDLEHYLGEIDELQRLIEKGVKSDS